MVHSVYLIIGNMRVGLEPPIVHLESPICNHLGNIRVRSQVSSQVHLESPIVTIAMINRGEQRSCGLGGWVNHRT